jgi:hypothetical protein
MFDEINSLDFEYSNLDYIKLGKLISKSNRNANDLPFLTYLISDLNLVSENLLKYTNNDKDSL